MGLRGIFTKMSDLLTDPKPINILAAQEGLFEIRKTEVGFFCAKTNFVHDLDKVSEGFNLALPKKIPFRILSQVIALFKDLCYPGAEAEALAQILWDREKQDYLVYVPKQVVSGARVDWAPDMEISQKYLPVMEIHSHNNLSIGAKFSSHDDEEQKETLLYAVVGMVDKFLPDIRVRISSGGNYVNIRPESIFESPFIDYPEEWANNITVMEGQNENND